MAGNLQALQRRACVHLVVVSEANKRHTCVRGKGVRLQMVQCGRRARENALNEGHARTSGDHAHFNKAGVTEGRVGGLGFGFWVLGFGFWVLGFGFWVLGFGFWVLGLGFGLGGLRFKKGDDEFNWKSVRIIVDDTIIIIATIITTTTNIIIITTITIINSTTITTADDARAHL